jgi:hypothetical protein
MFDLYKKIVYHVINKIESNIIIYLSSPVSEDGKHCFSDGEKQKKMAKKKEKSCEGGQQWVMK